VGPSGRGLSGGRWVEELDLALLDGQRDPLVNEFPEPFVDGEALVDLADAVRTHEPTHWLAMMDVGELVVGPMPARMVGVQAAAPRAPADLILARDAAGMHGAESA
jgi:hypothetical protein